MPPPPPVAAGRAPPVLAARAECGVDVPAFAAAIEAAAAAVANVFNNNAPGMVAALLAYGANL